MLGTVVQAQRKLLRIVRYEVILGAISLMGFGVIVYLIPATLPLKDYIGGLTSGIGSGAIINELYSISTRRNHNELVSLINQVGLDSKFSQNRSRMEWARLCRQTYRIGRILFRFDKNDRTMDRDYFLYAEALGVPSGMPASALTKNYQLLEDLLKEKHGTSLLGFLHLASLATSYARQFEGAQHANPAPFISPPKALIQLIETTLEPSSLRSYLLAIFADLSNSGVTMQNKHNVITMIDYLFLSYGIEDIWDKANALSESGIMPHDNVKFETMVNDLTSSTRSASDWSGTYL